MMYFRCVLSACLMAMALVNTVNAQTPTIPHNAIFFAKFDLKPIWQSTTYQPVVDAIAQADPALVRDFKKRFPVTPADVTSVTSFAISNPMRGAAPVLLALVHLEKDVTPDSILRLIDAEAAKVQLGAIAYYDCPTISAEVRFLNKRTLMVGPTGSQKVLAQHKPGTGRLKDLIEKADTLPGYFIAIDVPGVLSDADAPIPPEFAAIAKMQTLQIAFDRKSTKLSFELNYPDQDTAKEAETAIRKACDMGRQGLAVGKQEMIRGLSQNGANMKDDMQGMMTSFMILVANGGMNQLDAFLANPGLIVKGPRISKSIEVPDLLYMNGTSVPILIGLLLPAVQKVREAAARTQGMNNQKQMILAFHSYHDANGCLPNDICDKNGKPLLSWRVTILPYIEQDALYKQFKLDEPWDSPNNKPLSEIVVKLYTHASDNPPTGNMTHYQVFTGKGTCFEPGKKMTFAKIADGMSNTGIIFEVKDAVIWTKPGDVKYDPKMDIVSKLLFRDGQRTSVAMCDGSVRQVTNALPAKTWHKLITPADGEAIDLDDVARPQPKQQK